MKVDTIPIINCLVLAVGFLAFKFSSVGGIYLMGLEFEFPDLIEKSSKSVAKDFIVDMSSLSGPYCPSMSPNISRT